MKTKIKIVSLILASIVGLLLGGNIFADGGAAQSASFEQVSAQIEQVRQKVDQLTAELKAKQTAPIAAPAALTQEQLNHIENEIKRIAKETERLKVEVSVFIALREIERKAAQITAQITAGSPLAAQPVIAMSAPVAATARTNEEIEAQVAKIKQQINELTQEMEQKIAAEQFATAPQISPQASGVQDEIIDEDESKSQEITILPADEKTGNEKEEQKGFWSSVGDFFKKIFTF